MAAVPADIDQVVWELCMDHEGNIIRDPNDILHRWNYEQVTDALELKNLRQKAISAMRPNARTRK